VQMLPPCPVILVTVIGDPAAFARGISWSERALDKLMGSDSGGLIHTRDNPRAITG